MASRAGRHVSATASGDGGATLTGTISPVLNGAEAAVLLVPVTSDDGGTVIYLVDGGADGLTRTRLTAVDHSRSLARVVLAGRRVGRLEALAAELPDALAVPVDMRDPAQVKAMIGTAVRHYGGVDVLINNAGVGGTEVLKKFCFFGSEIMSKRNWMGMVAVVASICLIAAARAASAIRVAGRFGVTAGEPAVDYARVRAHVQGVIAAIAPTDSVERFTGLGVRVIREQATFVARDEVAAGAVRGVALGLALGELGDHPRRVRGELGELVAESLDELLPAAFELAPQA